MTKGTLLMMLLTWIAIITIMISIFGLWIYSLIEISKNQYKKDNKTLWVIVVFFGGPIGAAIYWLVGRKDIIKKIQQPENKTMKVESIQCKCGNKMIVRSKANKNYWVCTKYPDCKEVIAINN